MVVKMDVALRDFTDNNPGMKQFVERYELASADKETRTAYRKWEYEQALHIMEMQLQKAETKTEVAKNALAMGLSAEQIEKLTGLTIEAIEQIRNAD
jgi:predicted transposase YdaD